MSLLRFLRVIDFIAFRGDDSKLPPRNRRLELETLERRAVLTLLDPTAPLLEPIETTTTTTLEAPSLTESPPPTTEETTPDTGGSGSGTGEPDPGDPPPDPTSETPPANGGSGSGSGDPSPDPPPDPSGSGSGSGAGGEAPIITSLDSSRSDDWVMFVGMVSDADGPVEGLTVYFTIGLDSTVAFTTTVNADGTFQSLEMMLAAGTLVNAYTIDAQGNYSLLATCNA